MQRIKVKDASIEAYDVKVLETGEQKKLKRSNLIGGKNNGALAKLDIRNNNIPDDQQAKLKGICTSKGIDLTL